MLAAFMDEIRVRTLEGVSLQSVVLLKKTAVAACILMAVRGIEIQGVS